MSNLNSFILVKNDGKGSVTVKPCGFANGIAEWQSADSRSQAYRVTASLRQKSASVRRYTVKLEIPKKATQTAGGVELPVTAWRSFISIDVSVPVYATSDDTKLIVGALQGLFDSASPVGSAISENIGFF